MRKIAEDAASADPQRPRRDRGEVEPLDQPTATDRAGRSWRGSPGGRGGRRVAAGVAGCAEDLAAPGAPPERVGQVVVGRPAPEVALDLDVELDPPRVVGVLAVARRRPARRRDRRRRRASDAARRPAHAGSRGPRGRAVIRDRSPGWTRRSRSAIGRRAGSAPGQRRQDRALERHDLDAGRRGSGQDRGELLVHPPDPSGVEVGLLRRASRASPAGTHGAIARHRHDPSEVRRQPVERHDAAERGPGLRSPRGDDAGGSPAAVPRASRRARGSAGSRRRGTAFTGRL